MSHDEIISVPPDLRRHHLDAALVIALSTGGAYASSLIHTNQIANGAVTTKKLATGAVTTAKVRTGAVTASKLDAATQSNILPPWGTIPHGKLVTGTFADQNAAGVQLVEALALPAQAPTALTSDKLGLGAAPGITADPRCAGTYDAPNPASGMFCVYFFSRAGLNSPALTTYSILGGKRAAFLYATPSGGAGTDVHWWGVWAYKAP